MISEFIKKYGLGAAIILGACILGFLDIGLIGGIAFSSKVLFLGIGIVFMAFYMPAFWSIIKNFIIMIAEKIKAIFSKF